MSGRGIGPLSIVVRGGHRLRRQRWALRTRLKARLAGADLTLDIDPTARISPDAVISLRHGCTAKLTIGPGCRIDDGVLIELGDGTITMTRNVDLRRGTVLQIGGDLFFGGDNILSYGCTVHCQERVVVEQFVAASEYVTITDSRHFHSDEEAHFYHNSESSPVAIGRNTWIASKATILMGAHIGANCVVACHSVVSGDIAQGSMVAGAPARTIRRTLPHLEVRGA